LQPVRGQPGPLAHGSAGLQPTAHASAILPLGRSSQTVNRVAHQVSDQGRSQSRVSRSEVASSSGFCLSFGSTLPSCVPVMTRLEKRLTVWLRVKYAQNEEKRAVFINVTTVLPASCLLRDHSGSFRVPRGLWSDRILSQTPRNGKNAA
jgi:hypothetical protein